MTCRPCTCGHVAAVMDRCPSLPEDLSASRPRCMNKLCVGPSTFSVTVTARHLGSVALFRLLPYDLVLLHI